MLRYNEARNLIGFKYNNRSIRVFPVFEQRDQLNANEESLDELSNTSERIEDREEEEWGSNQIPAYKNGKKVDVQDLANTPKKVRAESDVDDRSSTQRVSHSNDYNEEEEFEPVEFDFSNHHFKTLNQNKIVPILISEILPEGFFITDFRIHKNVLIVAGTNFQIIFICLITKTILKKMTLEGIANCIAISKDGKYLAVGIVQDLNIYEIRGNIETDLSIIWLMKKFYCLHKGKILPSLVSVNIGLDRIVDIEFWINSRGLTLLTGSCDKTIRFINLPNCEISKTQCDAESKAQPNQQPHILTID
jgi:WD40 repeat protein